MFFTNQYVLLNQLPKRYRMLALKLIVWFIFSVQTRWVYMI